MKRGMKICIFFGSLSFCYFRSNTVSESFKHLEHVTQYELYCNRKIIIVVISSILVYW